MNETNQTNRQNPSQPYTPVQNPVVNGTPYMPQQGSVANGGQPFNPVQTPVVNTPYTAQPNPQPTYQQPYQQPVYQQPQYQQPTAPFVRKTFEAEEAPKKSKLPLILILSGAGVVLIAVAVILFFVLRGGGSKADEVQEMIAGLGDITLESGDAILAAEEAYAALETKDQIEVTNETKLESAREDYDRLKKVYDAIAAIGTVDATDVCYERIDDAWDAYHALPGSMQKKISNFADLEAAQQDYDQKKADEVIRKIDSIGTVTLKNRDTVEAARGAYDALTSDQKDLVSNKAALTAAEKTLASLQESQGQQKLKALVETYDSAEGITWYQPKAMPEFIDERSFIMPYLGQKSGKTWVRLVLNYAGVEWLNFNSVSITIDGVLYYQPFGPLTVEKGDKSGNLWETADFLTGTADLVLLEDIADSETTVVRFEGPEHYYDLTVSTIDKKAIRQVLDAYEAVK